MFSNKPSSFRKFIGTILLGVILVAVFLAIKDPMGIFSRDGGEVILSSEYAQLLAIEPLHNSKARLGYVNGICETNDLGEVLNAIKKAGKGEWFFGIPLDGTRRKGEYINLVYVDHFERIICAEGVYYRARLHVEGNQCQFVEGLITCGTEFFTERTYQKMVYALEQLGVGDADYFQPRRTIKQEVCACN